MIRTNLVTRSMAVKDAMDSQPQAAFPPDSDGERPICCHCIQHKIYFR